MKRIVHLSDIHFGRIDPKFVKSLTKSIQELDPEIIIISGDLTQRATPEQFTDAKTFIDQFSCEKIIIPGNHDVPTYNLLERFSLPFRRYRKYISKDLEPFYRDDEVAILGINTARRFTISDGRVTPRQSQLIQKTFANIPSNIIKILVGHHPFDLPDKFKKYKIIRGASKIMQEIVSSGVDLVLGGHMHITYIGSTAYRYKAKGKAAIVLQAATVSKRLRGEQPSFNYIKIDTNKIDIERIVWQAQTETFERFFPEEFTCKNDTWTRTEKIETFS